MASHKLHMFLMNKREQEQINRKTTKLIPTKLIKQSIKDHMNDFVNNKIRLGKIIYSADGGPNGGIPIYQARDGILNM